MHNRRCTTDNETKSEEAKVGEMRVALIGNGKTGGEVEKILGEHQLAGVYNTSNPPTIEALKKADVAIVFVPGSAVQEQIDLLLEASIPVVWGSTGCHWPDQLDDLLKDKGVTWITGENFSLSMSIMRHLLTRAGEMSSFLNAPTFTITETHHTNKKDAPSGTALAWERWLGHKAEINSIREGDVVGRHNLTIDANNETIVLAHEAKNRKCFAEGAIWAAQQIVEGNFTQKGLYRFETVIDRLIQEGAYETAR